MSTKRYHRDLVTAVADLGAVDPRVSHDGRKHPRLVFTVGGRVVRLPVAGSPGCRRSLANTVAQVRRILERMT